MDRGIKKLAAAVIEQALEDYTAIYKPQADPKKRAIREKNRADAEKWFAENSRETFGYYWCLGQSEVNPNLIRKYLKKVDEENHSVLIEKGIL